MKKTNIVIVSLVALIVASVCSIFLYSYFDTKDSTETSIAKESEVNGDAEYDEISFNIELGDNSYFWATKTDAKTLKDLINEHEGDEFFKTSEENGKFKVDSYKNVTPKEGQEWVFLLENCDAVENFCIIEDFEDVKLTKNLNFFVIMGEKDKFEL